MPRAFQGSCDWAHQEGQAVCVSPHSETVPHEDSSVAQSRRLHLLITLLAILLSKATNEQCEALQLKSGTG